MAKTRSQTLNIAIKKEEEGCKSTLGAGSVTVTARNKMTKRKPSKSKNKSLRAQQVKQEEDTDTKALLKSTSNPSKSGKKQKILQEQITQLIHYIANHNMSVFKASRKVNISYPSGVRYYNEYINDPEKKIPVPPDQIRRTYTQEQIGSLIRYINDDKMTVREAASKVNMSYDSGKYYYNRYLKDPNHNIPVQPLHQNYTQGQKNEFIGYIVRDKMSILAASKKAKMNITTAQRFYHRYFKIQNPDIATPSHIAIPKCYTQEQRKEVVSFIVDDKMSVAAASRKANMDRSTTRRHYHQYLKDNNMEIPVSRKFFTQDEINQFIGYAVDDKMTISAASKKASMNVATGSKYYRRYLKDHNLAPRRPIYAQNQINGLIKYIVDDKMSITAASKKVNMPEYTGRRYYRQYQKDHGIDVPIPKRYTQEQKGELIRYIIDDKMSIIAASKKANMHYNTGKIHYHRYLKNQKRNRST